MIDHEVRTHSSPTFTPIFVAARLPGRTAHIAEQLAAGSLVRPLAAYSGTTERHLTPA